MPGVNEAAAWREVLVRPEAATGMPDDDAAPTGADRCPVRPCPYCALNLRHNIDLAGLYAHWTVISTEATRIHLENIASHRQKLIEIHAIFLRMGHTAPPPPPSPQGPLTFGTAGSGAAAADAATGAASSSDGMPAPAGCTAAQWSTFTSYRNYVWQFRSGKKQNTWSDYDDTSQLTLEAAFNQYETQRVRLKVEGWEYFIDLQDMTQLSKETTTTRAIRRVTRNEAIMESMDRESRRQDALALIMMLNHIPSSARVD